MTTPAPLPRRVEWRVRFFTRYFRRWMGKNFHAVRVSKEGQVPQLDGRSVIVVLNHPSWWDPLLGMVLANLFTGYKHYVPIDTRALSQYRVFEPMGFFGVEQSAEGAITFLKTSTAILSQPGHALWVTAQGQFTDPRQRPITLRPGIGHLLRRVENVAVVPLAIEYPFWQERFPEALAHFGPSVKVTHGRDLSPEEWVAKLRSALTRSMDCLASAAQAQDPARFETLIGGKVGIGGVYDWCRWLMAKVTGKPFSSSHAEAIRLASDRTAEGKP